MSEPSEFQKLQDHLDNIEHRAAPGCPIPAFLDPCTIKSFDKITGRLCVTKTDGTHWFTHMVHIVTIRDGKEIDMDDAQPGDLQLQAPFGQKDKLTQWMEENNV